MRHDRTLEASIEDAVQMFRAGLATLEGAATSCGISVGALQAHLTGTTPNAQHAARGRHGLTGSTRNEGSPADPQIDVPRPDHFVFYQRSGRWLWARVADSGRLVRTSQCDFRYYLECVGDARKHGWDGTPLPFLAASDRFLP
jgi:hypothetical protein